MFESGMNFSRRGLVILRNCAGREGETNPYPDFISLNLNRTSDVAMKITPAKLTGYYSFDNTLIRSYD